MQIEQRHQLLKQLAKVQAAQDGRTIVNNERTIADLSELSRERYQAHKRMANQAAQDVTNPLSSAFFALHHGSIGPISALGSVDTLGSLRITKFNPETFLTDLPSYDEKNANEPSDRLQASDSHVSQINVTKESNATATATQGPEEMAMEESQKKAEEDADKKKMKEMKKTALQMVNSQSQSQSQSQSHSSSHHELHNPIPPISTTGHSHALQSFLSREFQRLSFGNHESSTPWSLCQSRRFVHIYRSVGRGIEPCDIGSWNQQRSDHKLFVIEQEVNGER